MFSPEFFDRVNALADRPCSPIAPRLVRLARPLPGHHALDRSHLISLLIRPYGVRATRSASDNRWTFVSWPGSRDVGTTSWRPPGTGWNPPRSPEDHRLSVPAPPSKDRESWSPVNLWPFEPRNGSPYRKTGSECRDDTDAVGHRPPRNAGRRSHAVEPVRNARVNVPLDRHSRECRTTGAVDVLVPEDVEFSDFDVGRCEISEIGSSGGCSDR